MPSIPVRHVLFVLLGAIAVALACAMAATSAFDAHPDERYHVRAAAYYVEHWALPAIGAEATRPSYSPYGMSYLIEFDPTYFLAGKFAAVALALGLGEPLAYRAFNLALFALLVAVLLGRPAMRPFGFVLILLPQVWYVFSYFNNDALPLAIALALGARATAPSPAGARAAAASGGAPWRIVAWGIALAVLFLCKLNYLVVGAGLVALELLRVPRADVRAVLAGLFVVLLACLSMLRFGLPLRPVFWPLVAVGACAVAWGVVRWRAAGDAEPARRFAAAFAICLVVVAGVALADRLINGDTTQKAAAMWRIGQESASTAFKHDPGTGATGTFHGLNLRGQGVPFHRIFLPPHNWAALSVASSLGLYGYMSIRGPAWVYLAIGLGVAGVLLACARGAVRLGRAGLPLALWAAGGMAGIVLLAALHSWINDFQAQGRYLFPALVFLAMWVRMAGDAVPARALGAAAAVAGVASVYSFVAVGLALIPKA